MISLAGYVVMTAILLGLGLLLTRTAIGGSLGRWDASISGWFVEHRTPTFDGLTVWGSWFGDTVTVVGIAFVAVVLLAIGRHWAPMAFLVVALSVEVTTFLTTTNLIDRRRPAVPRMDVVPPTSSFPSGHTAAAIILYVGLAIIVTSLVRSRIVRSLAWVLAVLLPIAVGISRLYRGMHHPTDVIGSIIGAAGCIAFALLATRTGVAIAEANAETDTSSSAGLPPLAAPTDARELDVAR